MPNVPSPMGGLQELETGRGTTARFRVQNFQPLDLTVQRRGHEAETVTFPLKRAGCGGHELLLSGHETYLVLWLYSGQSEMGYELFQVIPALSHLVSLPYRFGEGFGPAFSPDERFLALAFATNTNLCPDDEVASDEDVTAVACTVEWVELHVQPLPSGIAQICSVRVELPVGSPIDGAYDH